MTNDAAAACHRVRIIGDTGDGTWRNGDIPLAEAQYWESAGDTFYIERAYSATTVAELRAEIAENDGVIAVWRRRAESAERQVAACKSVLVRWNKVIQFAEEIGYTESEIKVMTLMAEELAIAGAEATLTKESP